MSELPQDAVTFGARLTGAPREMVLAGFKLGTEIDARYAAGLADVDRCETGIPRVGWCS